MKLFRLLALTPLLGLSLQAQTASENYDGPHVFYRNGKTVVKQYINGEYKDLSSSYASSKLLTCQFESGEKFSFPLKKSITTDVAEQDNLPSSFFVSSDMEGEFTAFTTLLKKANVITTDFKWNYGKKHLYIVGDMVDRGQSVTEVLWLIYKLEDEAKAAGGAVHYILGNHEVMNLYGNYKDVNTKYTETTLPAMGETITSVMASNSELGRWLRSKNVIERYNKVAFVHGGITNEVANFPYDYKGYNDIAKHFVANKGTCKFLDTDGNDDADANEKCRAINSSLKRADGSKYSGLYWDRTVARGEVDAEELDNTLSTMVVDRMIIGHTVQDNIVLHNTYGDKVINIDINHHAFGDTGLTRGLYYGGGCYYRFTTSPSKAVSYSKLSCTNDHIATSAAKSAPSQAFKLSLSPNPFNDLLNITLPSEIIEASDSATEVKFFSLDGNLVKTELIAPKTSQISLDTQSLQAGEYVVTINNGHYTHSEKVLCKK